MRHRLIALAVLCAVIIGKPAAAQARYSVTDLGNMGYARTYIQFLADDGTASGEGYAGNPSTTKGQAYTWKNGAFTNLGALISTSYESSCMSVNASGNGMVYVTTTGGIINTYFYNASAGTVTNLASSSLDTQGYCMDPSNNIYGKDGYNSSFRWNGGFMYSAPLTAVACNKLGGLADNNGDMYQSSSYGTYPIPSGFTLGYWSITTSGMNMLGDIVGQFWYGSDMYPYLYKVTLPNSCTGTGIAMPRLSGTSIARTNAINDQRQAVGNCGGKASLWTISAKDIEVEDLNTLIPSSSGYNLTSATAINNLGWIGVNATYSDGTAHALILKPN